MTQRNIKNLKLDGGWLCQNFINTVHDRTVPDPYEYLGSYLELIEWVQKTKALPEPDIDDLKHISEKDEQAAKTTLAEIITTREMLHKIFKAIAHGNTPESSLNKNFNTVLSKSLSKTNLVFSDPYTVERQWNKNPEMDKPLYPVMQSAYDLLISDKLDRVKECSACGWLFLDKSKNNSRRWCDMQTCGSAVKAKKYYRKKKQRQ